MASMDEDEKTQMLPLLPPGQVASPDDTVRLIGLAGALVQKHAEVTGKEKFEHMFLYCLNLLYPSKGICAFYIEDFDDCDEHTLRVLQGLIGRSGYITSDFIDPKQQKYKGFWAWRPRT